jgi:hypothetical protein
MAPLALNYVEGNLGLIFTNHVERDDLPVTVFGIQPLPTWAHILLSAALLSENGACEIHLGRPHLK